MDKDKDQERCGESGNVLFYILIAVVLLAALSYAVSQSGRSGQKLGSERARILASDILEYSGVIGKAVAQLRLRGCTETQISFENTGVSGYTNATAPSNESCHVFSVNGAGVTYNAPLTDVLESSLSGNTFYGEWLISGANETTDVGTGAADLVLALPFLKESICTQINKMTGHGKSDGTPIVDAGDSIGRSDDTKFTGSFAASPENMGTADPTSDNYSAKLAGCIEGDTDPASENYTFYKVLIAR
ncbi:MAG: hypothetical protein ACPGRX_00990 [Bdellovibrionales bacterium]